MTHNRLDNTSLDLYEWSKSQILSVYLLQTPLFFGIDFMVYIHFIFYFLLKGVLSNAVLKLRFYTSFILYSIVMAIIQAYPVKVSVQVRITGTWDLWCPTDFFRFSVVVGFVIFLIKTPNYRWSDLKFVKRFTGPKISG